MLARRSFEEHAQDGRGVTLAARSLAEVPFCLAARSRALCAFCVPQVGALPFLWSGSFGAHFCFPSAIKSREDGPPSLAEGGATSAQMLG